jgi:pyruvate-ferredoxin/flavodoxin oxidoreductase
MYKEISAQLVDLESQGLMSKYNLLKQIKGNKKTLVKESHWLIGGDGWAYDIGFGGLDHVFSLNDNVNILIFDTEMYSNTGG